MVSYTSWRGVVGLIKPTHRPGSLEEFIRLLPEGIGVIPLFVGFQRGNEDEFREALRAYEERVDELAELGVDMIHPEGAPPFMVHGYKGEQEIIRQWEKKHKIPVVTASMTQVEALRALKVKKFVGVTYFTGKINETFSRYFAEAQHYSPSDAGGDEAVKGLKQTADHVVGGGENADLDVAKTQLFHHKGVEHADHGGLKMV